MTTHSFRKAAFFLPSSASCFSEYSKWVILILLDMRRGCKTTTIQRNVNTRSDKALGKYGHTYQNANVTVLVRTQNKTYKRTL